MDSRDSKGSRTSENLNAGGDWEWRGGLLSGFKNEPAGLVGIFPLTGRALAGYKESELRGKTAPAGCRTTFSSYVFLGLWRSWERA